jgi:hypothetical protein
VFLADYSGSEEQVAAMAAEVFDAWIDEVLRSVG